MELYGEFLQPAKMRFNRSSSYAESDSARSGLIRYGPFDSDYLKKDRIKVTVICEKSLEITAKKLVDGMNQGDGLFKGFSHYFKINLDFSNNLLYVDENELDLKIRDICGSKPDLVYIIMRNRQQNFYKKYKLILLNAGIPSQIILVNTLNKAGLSYTLENVSLATYAKIGGTPWTVSSDKKENNLIIGISRVKDKSNKFLVGFVTLFTNEGEFLLMHSKAPVISWDNYVIGMKDLIKMAITEFEIKQGKPDSIIIHFHKRTGWKEVEAIKTALEETKNHIPYALVHLNSFSNYRLFDSTTNTFVPEKGLKIQLSQFESILLLDGRKPTTMRNKLGVPRVMHIRIDKNSTIDPSRFATLIKQIYNFSQLNWRGFLSTSIPVTLKYSHLIAKMIVDVGCENWNPSVFENSLYDKSWFL